MKKQLFALFCSLALLIGAFPVSAAALEGESLRTADLLATLGLVKGTGSDYALDEPATRAQAAVLLIRLAGAEATAAGYSAPSDFQDVPAWCQYAVSFAADCGWISGITPVNYNPNAPISANAWCTMLLRMLGYHDKAGDFAVSDAAIFAQRIGLVSRFYDGTMTRGDVFETMKEALTFFIKTVATP